MCARFGRRRRGESERGDLKKTTSHKRGSKSRNGAVRGGPIEFSFSPPPSSVLPRSALWLDPNPSVLFDMNPFIISVPALVFFGLLSCAAPLLHVAGPLTPAPSTAPFPTEHALVMAYYPDWASYSLPPEKIDYGRFDWIDFAFALPDESFALTWDDPANAPALLDRLVSSAHGAGKHVKLSIGGWTGSQLRIFSLSSTCRALFNPFYRHFSAAVATEGNRKKFASNILDAYHRFSLDGIDIDWEYPGQQGNPGNGVSSSDAENFLLFLQLLRGVLPPSAKITAATQTVPFSGSNGRPLQDASGFAQVLDWVVLMNYDVWGCTASFPFSLNLSS